MGVLFSIPLIMYGMDYDGPWNKLESDIMYRGSYMQPIQHTTVEKYPPEAIILRADQYDQETLPPSIAWTELSLADKQLLSISPSIGNLTHVTKLYLLNNKLRSLPSKLFTGLVNLTYLDISNNQITSIPSSIENSQKLKTLILSKNSLSTLPTEMGRLWRLEKLSIDDNPIKDIPQSIINGGTKKIIFHLRDKMPDVPPLPDRQWINAPIEQQTGAHKLKVFTYNVLAESYATEEQHPYAPSHILKWENRKHKVLDEIIKNDADIICLQEVEGRQFEQFFLPKLREKGYDGIQKLKTRSKTMSDPGSVDGCAIFYRTSKLRMEDKIDIEYQSLAYNLPTGPGLDRTIRRDNIALFIILQLLPEQQNNTSRHIICNTHIHWDPSEADVKLMQVQFMLEEI